MLDAKLPPLSPRRAKRHHELMKIAAALDARQSPPTTHEELRAILRRRIYLLLDDWRDCPESVCQRHRYCVQPGAHCSAAPPPDLSPLTPETRASLDAFYRGLVARAAYDAQMSE